MADFTDSPIFQNDLRPMPYWAVLAEDKLQAWADGKAEGYSTGFPTFDKFFRLVGGEMTVIAARPSQGKCLGKGTKILMYDGSLKAVEDVQVGDQLMGPDSTPRNVLSLARGREMMYWIHQNHGISYRVNESHILSLKRSKNEGKWQRGDVLNVPVSEVKDKGPGFFSRFKGYKVGVEYPAKTLPLAPYFLGLWLGDGNSRTGKIYNIDQEVIDYLYEYAEQRGETVIVAETNRPCPSYLISPGHKRNELGQYADNGSVKCALADMGLIQNKHIPQQYLVNSRENRLHLLAGLIDSDGYVAKGCAIEITFTNETLARDTKRLCDSLGYRTSIITGVARSQNGYETTKYRVHFNGNADEIPCRVPRKKPFPWTDFRDWQVTAISIEQDTVDDYYGFSIDGDHLFLLEDCTVTHNTILGVQLAENVARQLQAQGDGGSVAIFSAEMTGWSLVVRMAGALSGVNTHQLRMGKGQPDDIGKLRAALAELKRLPIWIDDGSAPTTKTMLEQLVDLNETNPIRMMLFDFMELGGDRAQSEDLRVGQIAIGLKDIAKRLKIPVVALSQLNRSVEDRANKMPGLADLRYSGQIEQVADVVAFIMRPEYYAERGMKIEVENRDDLKGVAYLSIAKNRHGPVANVKLAFVKQLSKFAELAQVQP